MQLEVIDKLVSLSWDDCPTDWHAPFLSARTGAFFEWSRVTDIFPYQRSGSKFGRSWPIAEVEELLEVRLRKLFATTGEQRKKLFKDNQYRKISRKYPSHIDGLPLLPIASLPKNHAGIKISSYCWRYLDRHFAIEDNRFNDRMGKALWLVQGESQIYLFTMSTKIVGAGAGIGVSASVPDLDVFCGRGGKDVIPLYRDPTAMEPNVTAGLLRKLSASYSFDLAPEDLAAYVYALLGGQSYTQRFWNELETPAPRVPVSKEGKVFRNAAALGRRLIWLHTYAERFRGEERGDEVPAGFARNIAPVSSDPAKYPTEYAYDAEKREVRVGDGRFGPVMPEIWEFEVSGLKVVQSWLGYRMKVRAGRKSSPLDDIRPERWTPRMTDEFLELLWVLEATLAMEPQLSAVLDAVVAGACFKEDELPQPTEADRRAPGLRAEAGDLLSSMEADDLVEDD